MSAYPQGVNAVDDTLPRASQPAPRTLDAARLRVWLREMARFLSVGAVAFVLDLGLFNLLLYGPGHVLGAKPLTAKLISLTLATVVSWVGNRYWTFSHRRTEQRGRELAVYGAINVVGALIPVGTLAFSRYVLDVAGPLEDNAATVLGIAMATVLRYVGYKLWVFTGAATPAEVPATDVPADDVAGAPTAR